MQPLVPLVFHNLPSLYPLHLIFYTCFIYPFLTVLNAPSKTMLEYRCKKEMLIPPFPCSRIFFVMQHAGIELGPHRYDATLQTTTLCYTHLSQTSNSAHTTLNFITRVRAGEVGVAHYPKWRRSLLIHAETRDFHSRRGMGARTIAWGRCTPLTIVDQFGIKIIGFTLSCEVLGRLLKKKKKEEYDDENSKIAYERFLV